MDIDKETYYKPMQIVDAGWIKTPATKSRLSIYNYVLKLIEKGLLKATDYGLGKTKYYKVKGEDILNFLNQ